LLVSLTKTFMLENAFAFYTHLSKEQLINPFISNENHFQKL